MDRRLRNDRPLTEAMAAANHRYALQRDALLPPGAVHRPVGGVGGSTGGVKCLHAHYADHAAGNHNPIGTLVAPWVEPLDCTVPCITDDPPETNPAWSEPR